MTDHKERAKEVWHWNRAVKGDDHPDTQRALREMQEAHDVVIKVDLDEALKLAEAAQTMLKALEEIKRCNEHYNFGSKLLRIVLPAIAAAKAAGITAEGEESHE